MVYNWEQESQKDVVSDIKVASNILLYKHQHYIKLLWITVWYIQRNDKIQVLAYLGGKRERWREKRKAAESGIIFSIFQNLCLSIDAGGLPGPGKFPFESINVHKWSKISLQKEAGTFKALGDPLSTCAGTSLMCQPIPGKSITLLTSLLMDCYGLEGVLASIEEYIWKIIRTWLNHVY